MLLNKLFTDFENHKIKYFIYKGISHLIEDLNATRDNGDIDIYVVKDHLELIKEVLILNEYFPIPYSKNSFYKCYTNQNLISRIDICTKINLGREPFKPYFIELDYDKLKIEKKFNVNVLASLDYFPLQFLIRILSHIDKDHSVKEISNYYKEKKSFKTGYINSILMDRFKVSHKFIEEFVYQDNWIVNKKELRKRFILNLSFNRFKLFKSSIYYNKKLEILHHFFKLILNPRTKGLFIVFQGVDGSGKSSTIDYLSNNNCIKTYGVKSVYFGNNQYWIPLLNYLLKLGRKPKLITFFTYLLMNIDRRLRILPVLVYLQLGYIVLGDRYFYDDLISYSKETNPINNLKNYFKKLLRMKRFFNPDIIFFMDVAPEIAYKRKQDYPIKEMILNVKYYRDFFYNQTLKNLFIINCNDKIDNVRENTLKIIKQKIEEKFI